MKRFLLILTVLMLAGIGCGLSPPTAAVPPTATPPAATQTELLLPTSPPGPSETPLGGQFVPTSTFTPSPTIPSPTPITPTATPTATPTSTPTATPNIASTGPLAVPLIEFTNPRTLEDGATVWTAVVHAVGGNGIYTYLHGGTPQPGPIFNVPADEEMPITVYSGDGQEITCDYRIDGAEYASTTCIE